MCFVVVVVAVAGGCDDATAARAIGAAALAQTTTTTEPLTMAPAPEKAICVWLANWQNIFIAFHCLPLDCACFFVFLLYILYFLFA